MKKIIHYFNPGHETAVLNLSPYYIAPESVLKMQRDLSFLPAWYGKPDDVVWVHNKQKESYYDFLHESFSDLPKPVVTLELPSFNNRELSFWGISPQAIHFFTRLKEEMNLNLILPLWYDEYQDFASRKPAIACLKTLIAANSEISEQLLPQLCSSIEEVEEINTKTKSPLLVKAPYSSSGRGLLWLFNGLGKKERELLHGMLKKQGYVTVEMVLKKETDFSMQFFSNGQGEVKFEGYSVFKTNTKGAYQESLLAPQEHFIELLTCKIEIGLIKQVQERLLLFLQTQYGSLYQGYISVDMMIYEDGDQYRIHPCVEINMRYSMGYLALQIQKNYLDSSKVGTFKIDYSREEGLTYQKHLQRMKESPLQIKNGKIQQGYLSLCAINKDTKYSAYILI